jgi:hypothetical protein
MANIKPKTSYWHYDYEDVVLRHTEGDPAYYRKFKGSTEHETTPTDSKLAADIIAHGEKVSKTFYDSF